MALGSIQRTTAVRTPKSLLTVKVPNLVQVIKTFVVFSCTYVEDKKVKENREQDGE